jgi:hypothetical protein
MTDIEKRALLLEVALIKIAGHYDPVGDFTWKDLALEMAEVAKDGLGKNPKDLTDEELKSCQEFVKKWDDFVKNN